MFWDLRFWAADGKKQVLNQMLTKSPGTWYAFNFHMDAILIYYRVAKHMKSWFSNDLLAVFRQVPFSRGAFCYIKFAATISSSPFFHIPDTALLFVRHIFIIRPIPSSFSITLKQFR
jgi:hypothetical protein